MVCLDLGRRGGYQGAADGNPPWYIRNRYKQGQRGSVMLCTQAGLRVRAGLSEIRVKVLLGVHAGQRDT